MPEALVRLAIVSGLTALAFAPLTFGEGWMARLPGGDLLVELPVVLPLACTFFLLSAASLLHEKLKSRRPPT